LEQVASLLPGCLFPESQQYPENHIDGAICWFHSPFVGKARFMAKRRGNPNWGKPEPIGPIVPTITEFEQVVREYKLTPDQYLRSTRLREWARRNKNSKYIPEPLLEAWGFEIESTL
jgi:hypothetical protein